MKKLYLVFAFTFLGGLVSAEGKELETKIKLHAYGVEVNVGFKPIDLVEGLDSIFWVGGAGAYKFPDFFRDSLTDQALSTANKDNSGFSQIFTLWRAGFAQGILYNSDLKKNLLEGFLFYQGQFLANSSSKSGVNYLLDSHRPDKAGLLQNSLLVGLSLNNLTKADLHGLVKGYYEEASLEYAPRLFQSVAVDFTRLNFTSKIFYPLFDLDPAKRDSTFSILLGNFTQADYLVGDQIPVMIEQGFGGRDYRTGLGSSVRGTEEGRFDGKIKLVNNLDLRINFPTVFMDALIPGVVAYFDVGAFGGLNGQADAALFSTGYGAFINLLNLGELAIYQDYWLNGSPYKASAFRIALGLHF